MKNIKLNIDNYEDRMSVIRALINAGYKVWTENKVDDLGGELFFVCFEVRKVSIS